MNDKTPIDPSIQSGSYALDALDAHEQAAFERHLAENDDTRAEVTELTDTAVLLGMAVPPVAPPPELKARLMELIESTPQLPSEPAGESAESAENADQLTVAAAGPAELRARARWTTRPIGALLSAAAVLAILAGGGIVTTTIIQDQQRQVQSDLLAAINAADDVQRVTVPVDGGTATLVWSGELLSSALITDALAPLPAGKVYELWYIGESGPRSAGTFSASDGRTWRVLEGDMRPGDVVGVTVEPRGGSEQPTTDPVIVIESA